MDEPLRAGSLCTGIGGLDLAVEAHFGAELAWYSEVEAAPITILERQWPEVPNLGDLTVIDWHTIPAVDVLSAGYPCQPFSHAGKRKGKADVRHLWPYIAEAVRVLRPRWVVLENVAGHLTLGFRDVLGDLAEAGFDAEWCVLRASDVGAPHQRARLFIVATDTRGARAGRDGGGLGGTAEPEARERRRTNPPGAPDVHPDPAPDADGAGRQGPVAPVEGGRQGATRRAPADAGGERHGRGQDGREMGSVDRGDAGQARQRQRPRAEPVDRGAAVAPDADVRRREQRDEGERRLPELDPIGAPAPDTERLGLQGGDDTSGGEGLGVPGSEPARAHPEVAWGDYEPAIRRWEFALGRPAPRPVDGKGRLSPTFVEWMQGYPEGWVEGLARNAALKALGNAVVPQQGYRALEELAPHG